MSRRIEMPDGSIRRFPDDATDEQIRQALLAEREQNPQSFAKKSESSGFLNRLDALSHNVAQPFNRGLLSIPAMAPEAFMRAQLPGVPVPDFLTAESQMAGLSDIGLVDPAGEGAQGVIPRTSEILGGGALPFGGIVGVGRNLLGQGITKSLMTRPVPKGMTAVPPQQGVMSNIAAQTALKPKTNAAMEGLAALGAGVAGETKPEDPMMREMMGGIAASLAPAAAANTLPAIGGRWLASKVPSLGPMTRGSKLVQQNVLDPNEIVYGRVDPAGNEIVPPRLDPNSPIPPALQTEEPRLVAMYNQLIREISPMEEQRVGKQLTRDIGEKAKEVMEIEGDPQVARDLLGSQGGKTVQRTVQRARNAATEAEGALKDLGINDDPSAISAGAKKKIDLAEKRLEEAASDVWESLGWESPGNYGTTQSKIDDMLADVGAPERGDVVPGFVQKELARAADEPVTLRDIHSLRKKIGRLKRDIKRGNANYRGDTRWLNRIEKALLKDMEAVDAVHPENLANARKLTTQLYDNFRRGNLGRVLGESDHNIQRVADDDFLREIVSGKNASANIKQALEAEPEIRGDIEQFLRHTFAAAASKNPDKFNRTAANTFIANLRERGVFKLFPDLEDQMINSTSIAKKKEVLDQAAKLAKKRGGARMERNVNKALASMYSDEGAGILLDPKTKNPVLMAKRLKTRMRGNEAAEDGLRRDFLDSIHGASIQSIDDHGNPIPSVGRFSKLINSNENVMRSLGFSDDHIKGLKDLAKMMRQAEAGAAQSGIDIFDPAGWMLNRAARVTGANVGALMDRTFGGGTAGTSLKSAAMGASAGADVARVMRLDPARKKVFEALTENPELLQELLLYDRTGTTPRKQARAKLNAWLVGMGAEPLGEDDWEENE